MSGVLETRLITPRNASFKATNWQDSPCALRGVQIKLSKPLKFKELTQSSLITTSTLAVFGLHVHLPTKVVIVYCPGNESFAIRKNIYELSDVILRTRSNEIFDKEENEDGSQVSVEDLMEEFRQLEDFHKIFIPEEVCFPPFLRNSNMPTLSHYMDPVPLLPIFLGVSLYDNHLVVPIDFTSPDYESVIMYKGTRLVFFQKIYSVLDTGRLIVALKNQEEEPLPNINSVVNIIRHHGEIFEGTDSDIEEEYTIMDKILDCYTQYPHVLERVRRKVASSSPGRLTPQQLSTVSISRSEARKELDVTPTRMGTSVKRVTNQPLVSVSKIRIFNSENGEDSSSSEEPAANQTLDSVHREMQHFISDDSSSSTSSSQEGESMKFHLDRRALLKKFKDGENEENEQQEKGSSENETDDESEVSHKVKVYTSALSSIHPGPQKAVDDPITSSLPNETEAVKTSINTWKETRMLPSSQDSLDKHFVRPETSAEVSNNQINVHKSSSQAKEDVISSSNEKQSKKKGEEENDEEIVSSNESRKRDHPSQLNEKDNPSQLSEKDHPSQLSEKDHLSQLTEEMSATQQQIAQAIEIDSEDEIEKRDSEPLKAPHTQKTGELEELTLSSSEEEEPIFRPQARALLKKKIRNLSFSDREEEEPHKKQKSSKNDLQRIAREEFETAQSTHLSASTVDVNQVVRNLGQKK